jgi:ribosomal protein S14
MVQMLALVEFVVLEKRQLSGRISERCRETGASQFIVLIGFHCQLCR